MDFTTFYYLSAQDKQVFLDSLPFSARGQYEKDYDSWFYNPNNPITNRETNITKVINVSACSNGTLQTNSYTVTDTPSNIDREIDSILSNFETEKTLNPGYSYTYGIDSPAPFLNCQTGSPGGGTGPVGPGPIDTGGRPNPLPPNPDRVGVTVYIAYCNNQVLQKESSEYFIFENQTSRQQLLQNVKLDFQSRGFNDAITSFSPITENINCITVSSPSPPGPSVPLFAELRASGCLNGKLSRTFKTVQEPFFAESTSSPLFVNFVRIQTIRFKDDLRIQGYTDVDIVAAPSLPEDPTCNTVLTPPSGPSVPLFAELRASGCLNGKLSRTFKTVQEPFFAESTSSPLFVNFVRIQTIRFKDDLRIQGYTDVDIVAAPSLPEDPTCISVGGGENLGGNPPAIPQVLAAIQFQECDGSIVNLNTSLAPSAPSVSINGIGISLDTINKGILGDFAYTYKTATSTIFSKPGTYTVTFGSISGWKTPSPVTFNLNSVNEYGGGNAGAGIYVRSNCGEPTTIAQIQAAVQFQECDGTILNLRNSNRPPAPSLTINGKNLPLDRFGPNTYESFILGDNAYIYRELTSLIYSTPGTYTVNFGDVPGWETPNPASFTLNSDKESKGGNEAIRIYRRAGCSEPPPPPPPDPEPPVPPGPGPTGPGPTPPSPTTTTTTTFRVPETFWLKRINPIDNRKYIFDITEGLFSNNERNLVTFFTGSTSQNYSRYYTHIYDENPRTSLTSSIQFSIAYGHSGGSGSLDEGNKINITPTRAIYSQYRNLVLGRPDIKFNLTGKETDSIYVINYQSKRLKDRLDAGVLELNIAHLSGSQFLAGGRTRAAHTGSNVKLAGNNRVLRLIDDSKININPDYTDIGYSYNIVSGTLETGVYNESKPHYYGKLIPSLGVVLLDGNKLDLSASFATSNASEIEGYNSIKLYKSFSGSALVRDISGDYLGMKARRVVREYNDYYFIRLNNREFNFTNNNSYFIYNNKEVTRKPGDLSMPLDPNSPEGMELAKRLTETNGEIYENFVNNPQVYITTVGLYNAQRELIAVGKLTKPILKNFTEESIFTVKLKY